MRFINRFAAVAMIAMTAVLLLGSGTMAWAQGVPVQNLAFPPFNPSQHVYKSRPIGNTPGYDVNINGLDSRIMNAASGLRSSQGRTPQVYELFVMEPATGIQAPVPGGAVAATILGTWKTKAAATFPADDFILLVMTRSNSNPNNWYVGLRVGTAFAPYISLPQIGNSLSSNMQTLRSGDVQGYSEAVIRDVSHFIGNQAAASNPVRPPVANNPPISQPVTPIVHNEGPSTPFPWGIVLISLIVIGGGVFVVIRMKGASSLRGELARARAKTDPAFKNLSGCVATIKNN
ncbi:MAG: hypothetical protein ACREMY_11875 [bacterium]